MNGEMSIIQVGHCSGRPNSKTATAATTIVAGSRANAAPSSLGTWVLTDPVRTPYPRPVDSPAAARSRHAPPTATEIWLSAYRIRPVAALRTGSARFPVSSVRSRSTADVEYTAAASPAISMRADR